LTGRLARFLLAILAVTGGCTRSGAAPVGVDQRARSGPVLGARPEAFGVAGLGHPSGSGRTPAGLDIRWETPGKDPLVVGVAELWDAESREAVSARGLAPAADEYARRFGDPDAERSTQ
jgi:hypothetical protein